LHPLINNGNAGLIKAPDQIMTVKQASEFLNVSIPTLYAKTAARTIPHYKKGKKLYFKPEELLKWISIDKRKTKDELLADWEEDQISRKKRRQ
jgi:excisionase family DNA binding protein